MARQRKGRDINGILLLDKPVGLTSNAALQAVKRYYKAAKAGHTGNLDPAASGLLPICLGEATKISGYLLDSDKCYLGTAKLGVRTRSADADGEVIETRPVPEFNQADLERVRQPFLGEIDQVPPMHSALKVNGVPLYKLAHQGKEIERQARQVTIYHLGLRARQADELELDVHCSKGTYIRTLAEDIGEALGCGAHLNALRRTRSGPFSLQQAISLDELADVAEDSLEALDALLLPIQQALVDWPRIRLSEDSAYYLQQGQPVQVPHAPSQGWVQLEREDGLFLGIGQIMDDGRVAPRRLIRSL